MVPRSEQAFAIEFMRFVPASRVRGVAAMVMMAVMTWFGHAAELLEARKIWDASPHNAFTDLARWKDRWWCVFREGQGHVSTDGAIRVLVSTDGALWKSAHRIDSIRADLRDPKLSIAPSGELMILAAGAVHGQSGAGKPVAHENFAWSTSDGNSWSAPHPIGETNIWMWRLTWGRHQGLGIGYDTLNEGFVRLYRTLDGKKFDVLEPSLLAEQSPNEHGMVLLGDQTALCLLRRDGKPGHGLLGESGPPYRNWKWKDVGVRIGGPAMIELPDGRLLAVVRLYDNKVRTSVCSVDRGTGKLAELMALPSGGDTSYAGVVWHEGVLWISYYSSHEGKTSIYLARVRP